MNAILSRPNETQQQKKWGLQTSLAPVTSLRPVRILVVEDDTTYRPFWESVLNSCFSSYELDWETTEKGAETLLRHAYRRNRPYDLVVADVFLAGSETGIDLWSRYGEATDNFIFVSGMPADRFVSLMALDYGYPVYLQKPLSAQVCKEIVSSLCETESPGGAK